MSDSKLTLKKLVRMLDKIKGRHTEMVTVFVPAGANLNDIINNLRSEGSTADNIKSKNVRKNVTASLDKIIRHLMLYKKNPANGLALFCGNISESDAKVDIELWAVEPPEEIKVKMYWCDQKFVLDPLKEMIEEKEIYGIICLDKSEADIALVTGKKIEPMVHFESIVPGKTKAGGQSSARFGRVREGLMHDWFKKVAEAANKIFSEHPDVIGIIISGSGPIKEFFLREELLHEHITKKILGTVDTGYTGEYGLHETLEKSGDLLKEASVMKEKKILQRFFQELQKPHGLAIYGIDKVKEMLERGSISTVIITEDSGLIIEGRDAFEYFEEAVESYGSKLIVVSSDTREGEQFRALSGIGAMLRFV
ncbi:MAG: peptide chain release factor aRF-1 [Candidatus Aenigmarchaeota archaeon]|nr:peptide chain release factor aRF-1 [Candidatus Aenigmarchaeota archaeon]